MERYAYRETLATGPRERIERVFDRVRGEEVMLRRLLDGAEAALTAFRREFLALASVRHPHVVPAHDYGPGFMTMALVSGDDPATRQDEAALRAWLPGAVHALEHLHAAGWPAPATLRIADGRAAWLTLGPSEADAHAKLGELLFQALTGEPPDGRRARQLVPTISPELDAALARLLGPHTRPSRDQPSQDQLPHDQLPQDGPSAGLELLASLGLALPLLLPEASWQGRPKLLPALRTSLLAERETWLVGPAGSGKTRTLRELKAQLQLAGHAVLDVAPRGPEPYAAVRGWLEALGLAPMLAGASSWLEGRHARAALQAAVVEACDPGALWLVDEPERLDAASRELLAVLRRAGSGRWLLASREAPADAPQHHLTPLPPAALHAAARSILLAPSATVLEALEDTAHGLPGRLHAALATWAAAGALTHDRGRYRLSPTRPALPEPAAASTGPSAPAVTAQGSPRPGPTPGGLPGPATTAEVRAALALHEIDRAAALLATCPDDGSPELALCRVHVHRARGEVAEARALLTEALLTDADQLTTAGVLAQMAGDYPAAAAHYEAAIAHADAHHDSPGAVRARLFAGRFAYFQGRDPGPLFTQAVTLAAGTPLHPWALSLHGHWLATHDERGLAELEAAIAACRAARQPLWLHEALNNLGDALLSRGRPAEARACFQDCLLLAERHGLANELPIAHHNLAAAALEQGHWREARTQARHALTTSRAQRRPYPEGLALAALALAEAHAGDPALALAYLAEAQALANTLANHPLRLTVLITAAELHTALGTFPRAAAHLSEAQALATPEQAPRLARAAQALATLAPASPQPPRAPLSPSHPPRPAAPPAGPSPAPSPIEAHAAWLAGDLERALRLARQHGDLALAACAEARLGQCDPARRLEAARRLRELAAGLDAEAHAAYMNHPWRKDLASLPPTRTPGETWAQLPTTDTALLALVDAVQAERGLLLLYRGLTVEVAAAVGQQALDAETTTLAHQLRFAPAPTFTPTHAALPMGELGLLMAIGRPRPLPEPRLQGLLAAFATQVGLALAGTREAAGTRQELATLEALHAMALAAMAARQPLQALVDALVGQLPEARVLVTTLDQPLAASHAVPPPPADLAGWVLAHQQPVTTPHGDASLHLLPLDRHVLLAVRHPRPLEPGFLQRYARLLRQNLSAEDRTPTGH